MEMDIPPPVRLSSISITRTKRAWSPYKMHRMTKNRIPASFLTPSISIKPLPLPLPLSTFRSVTGRNVYPALENEYATSGRARILVLQPNETLALVGTYSLCVLQGSLSLLGVTSNTQYTFFAPRSSPIPVLSWATSDSQGSCIFPIPPAIRQQAETTAILIEYDGTSVEGLGRICKVFENASKPPRESDPILSIDLPGIHIVCI